MAQRLGFLLFASLLSCASPARSQPDEAALTGGASPALRIAVLSDINGSACQEKIPSTSLQILERTVKERDLDHVILTGDAVAGQCPSYKGSGTYDAMVARMWGEFDQRFYQPVHDKLGLSIVLTPGNHDAPYLFSNPPKTYRTENEGFARYWNGLRANLNVEPVSVAGFNDKYPYYWAYTKNDVLFVVLQSTRTHSLADDKNQKAWLKALLRSPLAKSARARIAYGHVPPYPVLDPSVGSKANEIIGNEQVGKTDSLMDILLDHRVELLAVGHSHAPYPAELTRARDGARIKILSMPCGHAPRKVYGKSSTAPRGYAFVNISPANEISVAIHDGKDGSLIPAAYFPAEIPQKNSLVKYRRLSSYGK